MTSDLRWIKNGLSLTIRPIRRSNYLLSKNFTIEEIIFRTKLIKASKLNIWIDTNKWLSITFQFRSEPFADLSGKCSVVNSLGKKQTSSTVMRFQSSRYSFRNIFIALNIRFRGDIIAGLILNCYRIYRDWSLQLFVMSCSIFILQCLGILDFDWPTLMGEVIFKQCSC